MYSYKKYNINFLIVVLILPYTLVCQKISSSNIIIYPTPIGYTSDYEGVLSKNQIISLDSIIYSIKRSSGLQFAVVFVKNDMMAKRDLNEYAKGLFNSWGIGDNKLNNGILFLISNESRKVRIELGLGISKIYSNEQTSRLLQNILLPNLRKGLFYEGIVKCINILNTELKPNLYKL